MSYTGDLGGALEKAKEDLKAERENEEMKYWEWIKKKAETKIKAHKTKIEKLEVFIRQATRQIMEEEEGND